jgi:hypothetical protein
MDVIMRTGKHPMFLVTFDLTLPYFRIFCLRDLDKHLVYRWQDPAVPRPRVFKRAHKH